MGWTVCEVTFSTSISIFGSGQTTTFRVDRQAFIAMEQVPAHEIDQADAVA